MRRKRESRKNGGRGTEDFMVTRPDSSPHSAFFVPRFAIPHPHFGTGDGARRGGMKRGFGLWGGIDMRFDF
jgi:hypothetical protein